jgi:hypothetical protein
MATRAAQLALFIVELVTAARTPTPVFAFDFARSGVLNRRGIRQRARISIVVGGHSKLFG